MEQEQNQFYYILRQPEAEKSFKVQSSPDQDGYLNQNSLLLVESSQARQPNILFVPAYLRCHFRNMTEMDIQNLSCSFIATMNISFYLGKYSKEEQKDVVKVFAEKMHNILLSELKITFQNDFVLNLQEDLSSNVSDSDRLVRAELTEFTNHYTDHSVTRFYSNIVITREFKFGLHSDIFFFPLEQNILDLVTTLNAIKTRIPQQNGKSYIIRFNCMNLEIEQPKGAQDSVQDNKQYKELIEQLKQLYMQQNKGQELTDDLLRELFIRQKNHPFFRDIKISFPLKQNATEFGYYNIIERDVQIQYTRDKQLQIEQDCYERFKNCIFCKKKVINFDENNPAAQDENKNKNLFQKLSSDEDRSKEASFCNAIMSIPLLKASLGTIIQLCIPIFFLSFLTLVEFLYSRSTSIDQVRGQKIGSSTLIVATYISFIYLMRTVIPPTPSWSLFQVAVCLLAASCLAPIIQSIYQKDINNIDNPFLVSNGLFIASFILNCMLCSIIVLMLILIKIFMYKKIKRHRSMNVGMNDLLDALTKKYFCLWRNAKCKAFLVEQFTSYMENQNNQNQNNKIKVKCQI